MALCPAAVDMEAHPKAVRKSHGDIAASYSSSCAAVTLTGLGATVPGALLAPNVMCDFS